MVRPKAIQKQARIDPKWRYLILDGYIDEPATFGVPPYISPQVRSLAGGLVSGGADRDSIGYITVDQWRMLRGKDDGSRSMSNIDTLIIVSGCSVPGKYIRGDPISTREVREVIDSMRDILTILWDPSSPGSEDPNVTAGDPGVLGEDLAWTGNVHERDRTVEEWNEHLLQGAFLACMHPDHPSPLIAEIETSRGCPRFVSGGCSFCIEPGKGPVQYREPEDIISEVKALAGYGLENLRIGGQSDLLTYMSPETGTSDIPVPVERELSEMMAGVFRELNDGKGVTRAIAQERRRGIDTGIVHTDNANASVIHEHPVEGRKVLEVIRSNTTAGSVLALGLESSDPEVRHVNNLNSGPVEILSAVRMMNEIGSVPGPNGLPHLLPGLNFLGGLPGQRPESFDMDLEFLHSLLKENLLLRRINIRGALFPDKNGRLSTPFLKDKLKRSFVRFKERVRGEIDPVLLGRMTGKGNVLKGVYTEAVSGHVTFGRQIGSYPILIGICHSVPLGEHIDIAVSDISSRSVTGFRTPFKVNEASFRDLQALPGIGKRRAASLFRDRPVSMEDARRYFQDEAWALQHIST